MFSSLLHTTAYVLLQFQSGFFASQQDMGRKDIVSQALRTAFPKPSAFIEESPEVDLSLEPSLLHPYLKIDCVRCFELSENTKLLPQSVQVESSVNRTGTFHLTFQTTDTINPSEALNWKIRAQKHDLEFAVFSTQALARNAPITKELLQIRACTSFHPCRQAATFTTHEEAMVEMKRWIEQKLTSRRMRRAGDPLRRSDLIASLTVSRGDTLELLQTLSSGLVIKTRGQALKGGRVGDTIPIKIRNRERNSRQVYARIQDERTADYVSQ